MARGANFKVDPTLAQLLDEGYRSTEQELKELVDNVCNAEAGTYCITHGEQNAPRIDSYRDPSQAAFKALPAIFLMQHRPRSV